MQFTCVNMFAFRSGIIISGDPRIYVFIPQASVLPKVAMVLTIAVGARLTEGRGGEEKGD